MPLSSTDPLAWLALALAVVAVALAAIAVWRQAGVIRRYRILLRTPAGTDLEQLVLSHGAQLEHAERRIAALQQGLADANTAAQSHIQHIGVVRFSAFPDVGSDLSYAVAVLDGHHNGVVFSSLYSRHECRVYAKPIKNGASQYKLSDEETEALARALQT